MFAKSIVLVLAIVAGLSSAAPTQSSALGSTFSKRQSGLGTVYSQEGGTGSCGLANPDSALIVALGNSYMENQYKSPHCGRTIHATNLGSDSGVAGAGSTVTVTVADTCEGCESDHIDFSIGAWKALTNNGPADGTINVEWNFQ